MKCPYEKQITCTTNSDMETPTSLPFHVPSPGHTDMESTFLDPQNYYYIAKNYQIKYECLKSSGKKFKLSFEHVQPYGSAKHCPQLQCYFERGNVGITTSRNVDKMDTPMLKILSEGPNWRIKFKWVKPQVPPREHPSTPFPFILFEGKEIELNFGYSGLGVPPWNYHTLNKHRFKLLFSFASGTIELDTTHLPLHMTQGDWVFGRGVLEKNECSAYKIGKNGISCPFWRSWSVSQTSAHHQVGPHSRRQKNRLIRLGLLCYQYTLRASTLCVKI
ncbi:hypothetical protein ABG067_006415 [Albugo candida]